MLRSVVLFILSLVWAAILVLVGGRFIALLADANRDSEIVDRLYRHSDFWVKPFFGMFDLANKTVDETGGVFEPASLIALIVYVLAGMLVMAILSSTYGFVSGWRGGASHEHHA
jgi:hypothetical protein